MDKHPHYQATVSTPIGKLGIVTSEEHLLKIEFLEATHPIVKPKTVVAKNTVEQLLCYFADPSYPLNIPIHLEVSDFQRSVLEALREIPVGTTRSYTEIAHGLGTSPRPVGNACRHNPIPIIIPCHRVVSEKGIGGYNGKKKGPMLDIKQWLLQHENSTSLF